MPHVNFAWLQIAENRLGNRLPPRFCSPCWAVQTDDPAVLALSPLPDATLPEVDALTCLDREMEDSVRFSGHAALVTHRGGLVGLLTLENIQVAILTRLIARSRAALNPRLMVAGMMTRWERVPIIQHTWMSVATIEDVLWIFSRSDMTHLVVVDGASQAIDSVCGWISRVELLRRLDCR
jgi:hypothetical protein